MLNKIISKIKKTRSVLINYYTDYKLYQQYSLYDNKTTLENLEANLILNYHSIEKGMLFKNTKPFFAKVRVSRLHEILNNKIIIDNINHSQVRVGFQVMCEYYEIHKKNGWETNDYYKKEQYDFYKSLLAKSYVSNFNGAIQYSKEVYYQNINSDFEQFSNSRKSVRNFTGQKIEFNKILKAINLAKNAPSVCNRQASKVYLIEDKQKIDAILKIQGGFNGYEQNVSQLLIVTNDRSYYYTLGERNQFFIDGGIFLLNLLYALHFFKIGNCPANWGKIVQEEKLLEKIIQIPKAEKIICLIPIGELVNNFKVTLSKRRDVNEILKTI